MVCLRLLETFVGVVSDALISLLFWPLLLYDIPVVLILVLFERLILFDTLPFCST